MRRLQQEELFHGKSLKKKGRDLAEGIQVAKMLESFGYDMLDCDNGSYDSWFWPHPPMYMPKACNLKRCTGSEKSSQYSGCMCRSF
ncbi:MAG: hypothetical protein ACLTGQ_13635 [Mediterraneibacter gnavus]